jgi:cytochrome c biogenesis factor
MKMAYQVLFLVASVLFFLLDLFILLTSKSFESKRNKFSFLFALTGFVLIVASYVEVLLAFLNNDYSFANVYSYSSSNLSLFSKVYASWAGAGSSMLLLSLMLGIAYISLRTTALRKPNKFKVDTSRIFSFVLIIFIFVTLLMNPFESLATVASEGLGLNPQLQSPWMAIHPPIIFSAYTFIVLAYVLTLSSIKNGREIEKSRLFQISTYAGWILLTLGITLGGVWAYEVLGWGGYWAWDPVETASLLPWLLLTAYYVVKKLTKSKLALTREFMIMLVFSSLVLLSALTRGGFKQSVHSYAISAVGPVMLGFAASMIFYFFYLRSSRKLAIFKIDVEKTSLRSRSFTLGFWSLIFISVVCLVGLAFSSFSYSTFTFPFVLLFIVSLLGLTLKENTHYLRLLALVIAAVGIGVALMLTSFLNLNPLAALTSPLLLLCFSAFLVKLASSVRQKTRRTIGQDVLGIAMIILLIGIFLSAGAKTATTIENITPSIQTSALDLKIQLDDLTISNSSSTVYNDQTGSLLSEFSTIKARATIQQSTAAYVGIVSADFYPNYGLVLRPLIVATSTGDIYLHFEASEALYDSLVNAYFGNSTLPKAVNLTVQESPMIFLVWSGVGLMIVGMVIQFVNDFKSKKVALIVTQK